jgi:hypothetical protein
MGRGSMQWLSGVGVYCLARPIWGTKIGRGGGAGKTSNPICLREGGSTVRFHFLGTLEGEIISPMM